MRHPSWQIAAPRGWPWREVICPQCGRHFGARTALAVYCSEACKRAAHKPPKPSHAQAPATSITLPEWEAVVARSMTEKAWMAHVTAIAQACGWMVYHTWSSRHSAAGFPDLVLVRVPPTQPTGEPDGPGRVIFAELKRERGILTRAQFQWLEALAGCPGVEVYVWTPGDRESVLDILR